MSPSFRFRLVHLFYVITLLASSLASAGPAYGLILWIVVTMFWGVVYVERRSPDTVATVSAIAVFLFLLFLMIAPHEAILSPRGGRWGNRKLHCRTNLVQISLALRNYQSQHGSYPPAYLVDAEGRPAHSWRVLLLPYLDASDLYAQYRFDEPWDGPHNRQLLDRMPAIYRCPSEAINGNPARNTTSYVAVTGARTAWPGAVGRKRGEIMDDTMGTLQLVEASELNIPWLAPRDPSLEEWLTLVADSEAWPRGHMTWDTWGMWSEGRHVAECSHCTEFVGHHLSAEDWTRLWQIDDGVEPLYYEYYWPREDPLHRFRAGAAGRALAMLTFFVLTLLPTYWLRKVSRRASDVAPPASESG